MASKYSEDQLKHALYRAHQAGDTSAAQLIADEIKSNRAPWYEKTWDATKSAVKGDAALELPNINEVGLDTPGIAKASVFGSDEDYVKAVQQAYPDAQILTDANGNPYIQTPDGKQAYINQPGLDPEDVTRVIGKVASFSPAARISSLASSMMGKMAVTGGAAAATDAGMQKVAGREDVDYKQSALAGMFGAGGELAAPLVGRAWQWAKQAYRGRQAAISAGRTAAGKYGIADDLSDDQYVTLAYLDEVGDDAITAQSKVAQSEFGYKPTKGQMTGDVRQLSREERLRSSIERGQPLRDLDDFNTQQTVQNMDDMQASFSGGSRQAASQHESAQQVHEGLLSAKKRLSQGIDDAYGAAKENTAFISRESVNTVPSRLLKVLRDSDVVLDDLTPAARTAMERVQGQLGSLGDDVSAVSLKAIERERRVLNDYISKAANPSDKRAVTIMKKELDSFLDDAIDNALFSGDAKALAALKQARNLRAEYGRKFESKGETGRIIQKLIDPDATPEQVANYLVGVNGLSKAGAARVASRYKDIVGVNDPAFNSLRELVFMRLSQTATGDVKNQAQLMSTFRQAMSGRGQSLMHQLFTQKELNKMDRFVNTLGTMQLNGMMGRSSGTAERFWRWAEDYLSDVMLIKYLPNLTRAHHVRSATNMPRAPINTGVPGAAGAVPQVVNQ